MGTLKYAPFTMGRKYLQYLLTASNGSGHGVHSPFVYDLIRNVLMDTQIYPAYIPAEQYRRQLLSDDMVIEVKDLGAGSRIHSSSYRKISSIARTSAKSPKFGTLLYRLGQYYQYTNILELGTSLGVTTTYLAGLGKEVRIITMEGAESVADYAEKHFKHSGLNHVKLLRGNFDFTLPAAIKAMPTIDLAFIDGNHRYEPTTTYVSQLLPHLHEYSCLILDDIHWSAEMEEAWEDVKKLPEVTLTIDLFFIGLVFFRNDFYHKQDFTIRF